MFYTQFKEYLKSHPAKQDKIIKHSLIAMVVFNVIAWLLVFLMSRPASHLMVLHYTIYFGIDLFNPWYWLLIVPAVGLLISLINFSLIGFLFIKEKLLAYFLAIAAASVNLLLILYLALTFYINR